MLCPKAPRKAKTNHHHQNNINHPNDVAAQHAVPVQQCNGKHAAWGIGNGKPCGGGLDAACCVPTWGNNLFMVTTVNEWES